MRKIKFRGWNKEFKEFEGPYSLMEIIHQDDATGFDDECIFQQFTGLLDKNGKDIYEGDLIKITRGHLEGVVEIYWKENEVAKNHQGQYSDLNGFIKKSGYDQKLISGQNLAMYEGNFEVIGNIYENTDLIN